MAAGVYRDGVARLAPETSKILYYADGKTATVSVLENARHAPHRTNGKTDARWRSVAHRPPTSRRGAARRAPLGANPQAKRAAVIGLGSGITTAALLASPRCNASTRSRSSPHGGRRQVVRRAQCRDVVRERSHFVFDDAKAWLARSPAQFDIIASEPSNPWVSGVATLFTEEFYARIAKHLAPGGMLAQWIQVYEMDGALLSSIFGAWVRTFRTTSFTRPAQATSSSSLHASARRKSTPRGCSNIETSQRC